MSATRFCDLESMMTARRHFINSKTLLDLKYTASSTHRHDGRAFSASPRRPSVILDVITAPPMQFMEAMHAASVPWWAIIPSTALAMRGLVYFLTFKRSHDRARARAILMPVARAQLETEATVRSMLKAQGLLSKEPALAKQSVLERSPLALWLRSRKIGREVYPELFKRAYLSATTRIAVWLVANEAIRLKLGMETTLLRSAYDAVIDSVPGAGHTISHFDPSTQTQGLAWCSDLTTADPTGLLQSSLFLLTCVNLLAPASRRSKDNWVEWLQSVTQQQWTFVLCMGVIYSFLWHMPAGLHLYWLSSALAARSQHMWLNSRRPIPRMPEKCKIPAYHKVTDIRPARPMD